ncbi:hypothetical protein [Microbulbifer elongatus]|nr:hypothetical protein [Microbulbifer elongatus]
MVSKVEKLRDRFDVDEYGRLEYGDEHFPLLAIRGRGWIEYSLK